MERTYQLVMGTANAYIQSPGILQEAGRWIGEYGKHPFIVTGQDSWQAAGNELTRSLDATGLSYEIERYRGECSYEEVERLKNLLPSSSDCIIGVGGGKVLDTAKMLAVQVKKPFIAVPTLAATCAAVTNLSIMYTEEGQFVGAPEFPMNTVLALVDTEVIAKAPVRYLRAGIGDTIAKWYESMASSTGKRELIPTRIGVTTAKLIYDVLLESSDAGVQQAMAGEPGLALQQVIDAVILLGGAVGGFGETSCRSAAAHAVHNGLTSVPDLHHALHGEKVAYGILVQLVLEQREKEEIDELLSFYHNIQLPALLADLGLERTLADEELQEVARISILPESTMGSMPIPVTADMVLRAIQAVEKGTFRL